MRPSRLQSYQRGRVTCMVLRSSNIQLGRDREIAGLILWLKTFKRILEEFRLSWTFVLGTLGWLEKKERKKEEEGKEDEKLFSPLPGSPLTTFSSNIGAFNTSDSSCETRRIAPPGDISAFEYLHCSRHFVFYHIGRQLPNYVLLL